jgi:hypothetical protein
MKHRPIPLGSQVGLWLVLGRSTVLSSDRSAYYQCQCTRCGKVMNRRGGALRSGKNTSCMCSRPKISDWTLACSRAEEMLRDEFAGVTLGKRQVELIRRAAHPDAQHVLFTNRTVSESGCWEWTGARTGQGYGRLGAMVLTHRLSAAIFLSLQDAVRYFVLHKCDNPPCFNPEHLYFGGHAQNVEDMVERDRLPRGEQRPNALLSDRQVLEIWQRLQSGERTGHLAREYGLTTRYVYRIKVGSRWGHITSAASGDKHVPDRDEVAA